VTNPRVRPGRVGLDDDSSNEVDSQVVKIRGASAGNYTREGRSGDLPRCADGRDSPRQRRPSSAGRADVTMSRKR
jgi:hypothetical protein